MRYLHSRSGDRSLCIAFRKLPARTSDPPRGARSGGSSIRWFHKAADMGHRSMECELAYEIFACACSSPRAAWDCIARHPTRHWHYVELRQRVEHQSQGHQTPNGCHCKLRFSFCKLFRNPRPVFLKYYIVDIGWHNASSRKILTQVIILLKRF